LEEATSKRDRGGQLMVDNADHGAICKERTAQGDNTAIGVSGKESGENKRDGDSVIGFGNIQKNNCRGDTTGKGLGKESSVRKGRETGTKSSLAPGK
jgi:hypothetical protein